MRARDTPGENEAHQIAAWRYPRPSPQAIAQSCRCRPSLATSYPVSCGCHNMGNSPYLSFATPLPPTLLRYPQLLLSHFLLDFRPYTTSQAPNLHGPRPLLTFPKALPTAVSDLLLVPPCLLNLLRHLNKHSTHAFASPLALHSTKAHSSNHSNYLETKTTTSENT